MRAIFYCASMRGSEGEEAEGKKARKERGSEGSAYMPRVERRRAGLNPAKVKRKTGSHKKGGKETQRIQGGCITGNGNEICICRFFVVSLQRKSVKRKDGGCWGKRQ